MAEAGPEPEIINLEDSGIRLSVYQKTRIDLIRESVPKPAGYLPPKSLPTWELMPLEQKLPLLPAPPGALYFSRGNLGKTLFRKTTKFSTADPHNRERIPSNKYEQLHDPKARIDSDHQAKIFLEKQGAVNENGEVICTLKEFNRYRTYLATLYNDRVREKVAELDEIRDFQREADRALIRQRLVEQGESRQVLRDEKVAKAKKFLAEKAEAKRRSFEMKQRLERQRILELEQIRLRRNAEKIKSEDEKRALSVKRLANKKFNEIELRKEYLHQMTLKDMQSTAQREHYQNERKIIYEQKLADWFDAKLLSAAERLEREKEIQDEYSSELKRRARRRQKMVERFRAELPLRIAKRLAAQQRLKDIVRKYAMRWLNKVRERLRRPIDENHESLWYSDTKNCLNDSVKYLYEQSGYEKLDDVVLNILKFKEALKKQLLLDEEEEEDDEDDLEE